jgi:hypothetical protein
MNNGKFQESTTGVGKLPKIEPETFTNFCQYAYTGAYDVQGQACSAGKAKNIVRSISSDEGRDFPFCSISCRNSCEAGIYSNCIIPGCSNRTIRQVYNGLDRVVCRSCRETKACTEVSEKGFKYISSSPLFRDLWLDVGTIRHTAVQDLLLNSSPNDIPVDNLVAHAKLWEFAEMYMVRDLKQLCLHKLHRDLAAFEITAQNVEQLITLYTFVYQSDTCGKESSDSPTTLRTLMASYSIHQAKKLLEFEDFLRLLREGGDLTVDLMKEMVTSLL